MKWKFFAACYFLQYLGIGLFMPYLGVYFQSHGVAGVQLGWLLGVMPLARIIAQPLWSFAGDLLQSYKLLLFAASLVSGLSAAAFLLADDYPVLFVLVALFSILNASVDPYLISMTLGYLKQDAREEDFALIRLWGSVGFAFSSLMVGIFFLDELLYLLPVIYCGIMFLFAAVVMFLPADTSRSKTPYWLEGLRILPDRPALIRFFAGCLFVGATLGVSMQYQAIYMDFLGASGWMIGASLSLMAIMEIPLMVRVPWATHRFGVEKVLLLGIMALPLRWILFALIKDPYWILPVQLLHSLSIVSLMVVGMVYVSRQVPDEWKATGVGTYSSMIGGVGPALGLFGAGWVDQQWGIRMIWVACFVVVMVGIFIMLPVFRQARREAAICQDS